MRKVPTALVISIAAHGVAVVWVGTHTRSDDAGHARLVATEPADAAPTPPDPLVVDIIALPPDHAVPSADPPTIARTRGAAGPPRVAAIASGHGSGATPSAEAPGTAATGTGAHSDLMTMRRPEAKIGLSDDFIAKFLDSSKPVPPKANPSEQIADDVRTDREALANPRWVANATPDELFAMREKLVADLDRQGGEELKPSGGGRYESPHIVHDMLGSERPMFTAHTAPDGSVTMNDSRNFQIHGLGGSFDVTDWAMRGHGQDPYARQKLAWLDSTRDERAAIGQRHRHDVLARTPQYVQRNLQWLWQRRADTATRKRELFEMWDDCAEADDDDLVTAGTAARLAVLGFIRTKFPADSADAYSAAELDELNAHRRSKRTFAPYED